MKSIMSVFLLVASLSSATAYGSYVDIDHDKNDCTDGRVSMDVVVTVDGERFTFDPSCRFSFSDQFKTSEGVQCKIEAGMCSAFSPYNKIEVLCDGRGSESVSVDCPQD